MNPITIETKKLLRKLLRNSESHKGDFGHVLVVAGNIGFGGAALLSSKAAIKIGAGLVSLATRSEHLQAALSFAPEVMTKPVDSGQSLENYLDSPTVICLGPGLGKDYWSEQMIYKSLENTHKNKTPILIDADGLNLLPEFSKKLPLPKKIVLTPHLGEAARLLNTSVEKVKKNRVSAAKRISNKYNSVVVLKSHETLICKEDKIYICDKGNPGMATAGMGDVLSGMISGLIAQKLSLFEAACLGVDLHARAGDIYSEKNNQQSLLPTDIIDLFARVINE
tara:strand:- start:1219 stop:2058 length:840 start_codon:yes stop_codon:yes gene_type:complete